MAMQPNNPANATDANFTPGTEGITLLFQGDELRQTEPTRFRRPVRKPTHPSKMCGRVIQSSSPLRLSIVEGLNVSDSRMANVRPRYNAAPSQELLVIRENHKTGERSLDLIKWGLIPHWCSDPRGVAGRLMPKLKVTALLLTYNLFGDSFFEASCRLGGKPTGRFL
jgi:hypothetical protein